MRGSFLSLLSFLGTLFGRLLGLLRLSWGSQERKNADSPMRKPLFCNRLFGLLELHLVLLGSSRPLPGQSWGPDGSQKTPKSGPKFGQKWVQKGIQFWIALGPFLGLAVSSAGTIFQCFSGWLQDPFLVPSWSHFGSFLVSLGLLWGPTWPLLALSWPHFGFILAFLASLGALLVSP